MAITRTCRSPTPAQYPVGLRRAAGRPHSPSPARVSAPSTAVIRPFRGPMPPCLRAAIHLVMQGATLSRAIRASPGPCSRGGQLGGPPATPVARGQGAAAAARGRAAGTLGCRAAARSGALVPDQLQRGRRGGRGPDLTRLRQCRIRRGDKENRPRGGGRSGAGHRDIRVALRLTGPPLQPWARVRLRFGRYEEPRVLDPGRDHDSHRVEAAAVSGPARSTALSTGRPATTGG